MDNDEEIKARVKKKFLNLTTDKQQILVDSMTEILHKLEREWKADPQTSGKPFSYVEAWNRFAGK